jgi:hypothetical protein
MHRFIVHALLSIPWFVMHPSAGVSCFAQLPQPVNEPALHGSLINDTVAVGTAVEREAPKSPWYKGNLHTHSLWSDGDDFPEMIVDWYRERGYSFLALSDHNILSEGEKWISLAEVEKRGGKQAFLKYQARFPDGWIETQSSSDLPSPDSLAKVRLQTLSKIQAAFEVPGKFLLIPSEEITDKGVHINATNIGELIEPQGGASFVDMVRNNLRAVGEQTQSSGRDILPFLNHPNLSDRGVSAEELAWIVENRFFEVWNGVEGDGDLGSVKRHSLERMWDITTTLRLTEYQAAPMFGLATDDSHDYHGKQKAKPGRGWIQVRADSLSTQSILAAMRAGDFYSSTGVELTQLEFDPVQRRLSLQIRPDGDARFTTRFIGTRRDYDPTTTPRTDPESGEVVPGILDYSLEVGQVLATVQGLQAEYQFTGDELYVRAEVISSKAPEFPTSESPWQKCWTQPCGWQIEQTKPNN